MFNYKNYKVLLSDFYDEDFYSVEKVNLVTITVVVNKIWPQF